MLNIWLLSNVFLNSDYMIQVRPKECVTALLDSYLKYWSWHKLRRYLRAWSWRLMLLPASHILLSWWTEMDTSALPLLFFMMTFDEDFWLNMWSNVHSCFLQVFWLSQKIDACKNQNKILQQQYYEISFYLNIDNNNNDFLWILSFREFCKWRIHINHIFSSWKFKRNVYMINMTLKLCVDSTL